MILREQLRGFLMRSHRFPYVRLRRGRRLVVRMDTTNMCNLRCAMCPMRLSDGDPDRVWMHMDRELFSRIASEVFPLASVVGLSCGAEPFMNPDFPDHLETLYRADVPVREVVTNGLLLGGDNSEALLDTPPTTLFVSIDGADPRTHAAVKGGADLDRITGNIRDLAGRRQSRGARFPRISFSVTLQRSNVSELGAIIRLASDVGASSVNTVMLVPYEGLDMSGELLSPDDPSLVASLRAAAGEAGRLGVEFVPPFAPGSPGNTSVRVCPYTESWLFIGPDGKVFPCPYWDISMPFGDLSASDFREVWSGEPYGELRERLGAGILQGNCRVCPEMGGGDQDIRKVGSGETVEPQEG